MPPWEVLHTGDGVVVCLPAWLLGAIVLGVGGVNVAAVLKARDGC